MHKDDATWLNVGYVCFALITAYCGFKAIETLGIQMGWAERYDNWYPMVQTFGSVVIGAICGVYVRKAKNGENHEYYLASIGELRKVTWPTWPDVKRMTIVVCVVVAFFAVVLGIFDIIWAKALNLILA